MSAAVIESAVRVRFQIDLNSVTDNDRVSTLLGHTSDPLAVSIFPPRVGDRVEIQDDDRGRALASILAINGEVVDLVIDWTSWSTEDSTWKIYRGTNDYVVKVA